MDRLWQLRPGLIFQQIECQFMAHDVRLGQEKLKVGKKLQLSQSEPQRALLGGWPGVYLLRFAWTSVGKRPAVPKR